MESDYAAAEGREREAKNRANRRRHWLERGWRISAKGNEYLNTDSFNIVMFRFGQGRKPRISQREGAHERVSQRTYLSAAAAKLAAFDVLPLLAQRWEKGR